MLKVPIFQFGTQHFEDSGLLYVCGYISRCLLRSVKCSDCRELLCKRPDAMKDGNHSYYIDDISRGGLVEPSAFVFNAASHASQLFSFILILERICTKENVFGDNKYLRSFRSSF